jgi:biopolymer transport protein ExbD
MECSHTQLIIGSQLRWQSTGTNGSDRLSSEIKVTPLIDVLLVLLIIFMVIVPVIP